MLVSAHGYDRGWHPRCRVDRGGGNRGRISQRFDANYPHHKGAFARVIHSGLPYAQTLIDDFSSAATSPHIAISVDMLDERRLAESGVGEARDMDAARLYESPFTDVAARGGPDGLFPSPQVDELVAPLQRVRAAVLAA